LRQIVGDQDADAGVNGAIDLTAAARAACALAAGGLRPDNVLDDH